MSRRAPEPPTDPVALELMQELIEHARLPDGYAEDDEVVVTVRGCVEDDDGARDFFVVGRVRARITKPCQRFEPQGRVSFSGSTLDQRPVGIYGHGVELIEDVPGTVLRAGRRLLVRLSDITPG